MPPQINGPWTSMLGFPRAVERGDRDSLTNYRTVAPYPERAHPRPDHYMPLLTAFGAAGPDAKGKIIHHSWYWGDLGMDAHEFT